MSTLMQGFMIAIWVVLTMIYIRLGIISDEIKEKKKKSGRSCATCIFSEDSVFEEPCDRCVRDPDKPNYKGWDE